MVRLGPGILPECASGRGTLTFLLCALIKNPPSYEVRFALKFLMAQNNKPIKIHQKLCEMYGEVVKTENGGRLSCLMFKDDRINIDDEDQSGQ